jgi:predicted phosphodiesterase
MSICLLGDIHGDYRVLAKALDVTKDMGASALIQLGDFGLFPGNEILSGMSTRNPNLLHLWQPR